MTPTKAHLAEALKPFASMLPNKQDCKDALSEKLFKWCEDARAALTAYEAELENEAMTHIAQHATITMSGFPEALTPVTDDAVREAVDFIRLRISQNDFHLGPSADEALQTILRAAQQNTKKWTRKEIEKIAYDDNSRIENKDYAIMRSIIEALITAGVIEVAATVEGVGS